MSGINLSSSAGERRQTGSGFLTGSVIVSFVFFLVLALWGGMRWYMKTLDDKIAEKTVLLDENSRQLKGQPVDRVQIFDTRLTLAQKQADSGSVHTKELLTQLEGLVIPTVKLTKYEYNAEEKFVSVTGVTDNFKYVAQQLLNFKGDNLFSGVQVMSLRKDSEGMTTFSFRVSL